MFKLETLESIATDIFEVCNDYNSVDRNDVDLKEVAIKLEDVIEIDVDDFYREIDRQLLNKGYIRHDMLDFQWLKEVVKK